jgi:internalin A
MAIAWERIEQARRDGSRTLDLSRLKLTSVPEVLWQLTALQELDLSYNQLTRVPETLGQLTALQTLYLDHNQLTNMPEALGQLTALQALNLSNNQFTRVPEALGQLTKLNRLLLDSNQLTSLPESLGQLTALQTLWLSDNQLASLPESLGQLATLQRLDLNQNQLTSVPDALWQLNALQTLWLSDNLLTSVPEALGQLAVLQELRLDGNQLTGVPEALWQLTALQRLFLENNQLTSVPEALGQLTALRELNLDNNQLTSVPEALGQLTALRELHLENNQLTSVPEALRTFPKLEQLFLHGNPGLGIPEEALGPAWHNVSGNTKPKPPQEILDYYFSTRGQEGVALREMKLIVVGWGKAGKTTLVKRLAGERMDLGERETHGILIRPLALHCTDGELKARVWDFGGQVILHSMHEFFLTARSLYLLVIEQRGDQAEKDAKYWLNLIRTYAPGAPVVIALNKSRGIERPIDRESLEKMYGPILAWVPTECLPEADCPGAEATIANLRTALTAAAEEATMPEPRKRFPRKWVEIKDWLEDLDKNGTNYLDYAAFSRECAKRGEPDAAKQAEVAALMHDLGVAMNYARDERLRDTTVLRPDWLANGIYAVLRANLFVPGQPLAPDAVLTRETLGKIYQVAASDAVKMLKAKDYPAEKWKFLLELMNLFQLSFPISEDGERQLCPTLLRAEPPPGTDEPQGADRVQLRYEFAVVPAPLLPRFIVRTFSLIEHAKLWQRGAMLRYPDATAKVWTTAEEKYLFATVAGPNDDRTELLAIIRSTLTELFAEYRDLKVTEQRWFDGQWVPRQTLEKFGVLEPEWDEDEEEEEEEEE